jgi:hypothetical protein
MEARLMARTRTPAAQHAPCSLPPASSASVEAPAWWDRAKLCPLCLAKSLSCRVKSKQNGLASCCHFETICRPAVPAQNQAKARRAQGPQQASYLPFCCHRQSWFPVSQCVMPADTHREPHVPGQELMGGARPGAHGRSQSLAQGHTFAAYRER